MSFRWFLWLWVLLPAVLVPSACGGPRGGQDPPAADRKVDEAITVVLEDCKASRPGKISSGTSIISLLIRGIPKEDLAKKGPVTVDGRTYQIYLPKASTYPIKNSAKSDGGLENDSTRISIDFNGNGILEEAEGWYANMPIRLGDRMFEVREIAQEGDRIVLVPSTAPLRGLVEGLRCPPFLFKTEKGEPVSLDRLAGRAFLLDIWSVT